MWKRLVTGLAAKVSQILVAVLGENARKVSRNMVWLTAERVFNLGISFALSVWLARYLGPADFGLYNYAVAFVALFGFLTVLGLDGIATRELVLNPRSRGEILGTTFVLRLAGSSAAFLLVSVLAIYRVDALDTRIFIILVAAGMIFEAFGVVDTWFNSQTEARHSVIARSTTLVVSAMATLVLLLLQAPLFAFVLVIPLRQAVKAASFALLYRWNGGKLRAWRPNWTLARTYLSESWPLILSFASALVYLKIDQVMLGNMMDNSAVGVYAVAARLSESWYFLGPTIAISMFPTIVSAKLESEATYRIRLQKLYALMAWLAIVIAVAVSLTSEPIIHVLFGPQFAASNAVLAIHIWTCPFVFMGAILTKWLINEKLYMFALTRNLLGATANVALNLLLIPRYGIVGSALATLLSYTMAHYLACFTDSRTRQAGVMMTKAILNPFQLLRLR